MSAFNSPATIDYDRFEPREIIAAAPDFLAQVFGNATRPGSTQHPIAGNLDLATIAYAFGRTANQRPGPISPSPQVIIGQGLASAGFVKLFNDATVPVVLRSYQAAGDQRPFAAVLNMTDLKPQAVYGFDVTHTLSLVSEAAKIPRRPAFAADTAYGTTSIGIYAQIFELTRSDLLTNDTSSLFNMLTGAGTLAAQTEASLLAHAIEDAPQLSDGAVFDASNTLGDTLTADALAAAFAMLRTQGAADNPLNIAPRHVVVEKSLELTARKLLKDADVASAVQVSVLPGLAYGRWLVFGSPEQLPSLTLYKVGGRMLSYAVQRSFKTDGIDMSVSICSGAGFVGRVGVVKGGV